MALTENQHRALRYFDAHDAAAIKAGWMDKWIWKEDLRENARLADDFMLWVEGLRKAYVGSPFLPKPDVIH